MTSDQILDNAEESLRRAVDNVFNFKTIMVFIVAIIIAIIVSRIVTYVIIQLARAVGKIGDKSPKPEQTLRLRRIETYLSISLAALRAGILALAVYAAWQYTHPANTPIALLGAGTIFAIIAGATVAPVLRDLAVGSVMITEQWYNVGDYITLIPYSDISGVVERMNLRSTRMRSLNGEIVWIHNQHIQGVRVTPKGVRTLAIDIFVSNLDQGKQLVKHVASALPVGPTLLARQLEIVSVQKVGEKLWHIAAISETAPGREWLIENFMVASMKEYDKENFKDKLIVHGPMVRNADPDAERRFKRAVRMKSKVPTEAS